MRQTEDYVGIDHCSESSSLDEKAYENAKSVAEHISTFNALLNQLEDVGLQIFLFMTLLETWEDLGTYLPLQVFSHNCRPPDYLSLMISLRPSSC